MGDNTKSCRGRKIIILSRDAALEGAARGEDSMSPYQCLRVTSPYEAAAELLAEPPIAIVIDLRCLTPGDLPLIEMAYQRGLEVLAVGAVPLGITTTDLSGVRLSARGHLSALLEGLAQSLPYDGQDGNSAQALTGESPEPSSQARSIEHKASRTDRKAIQTFAPAPKAQANDKPPGKSPNELLTREELAALLEDES